MFRTTYENNKKELDIVRYGTFKGNEKDIKNAGIEELENIIDSYLNRIKNLEQKKNEFEFRKTYLSRNENKELLSLDDQINRCKNYIMIIEVKFLNHLQRS